MVEAKKSLVFIVEGDYYVDGGGILWAQPTSCAKKVKSQHGGA